MGSCTVTVHAITKLPHDYTTTIMCQSRHKTTSTKSRTKLGHEHTTTSMYQTVTPQGNYLHQCPSYVTVACTVLMY